MNQIMISITTPQQMAKINAVRFETGTVPLWLERKSTTRELSFSKGLIPSRKNWDRRVSLIRKKHRLSRRIIIVKGITLMERRKPTGIERSGTVPN